MYNVLVHPCFLNSIAVNYLQDVVFDDVGDKIFGAQVWEQNSSYSQFQTFLGLVELALSLDRATEKQPFAAHLTQKTN
jgi:hypothetical protein